jgi:predicted N-acyltransferase
MLAGTACRLLLSPSPQFYEFYQITIDKWWGRPYLKREFFHRIGEDMGDEVLLVVAEEQGETVAAALNMIGR